MCVARAEQVIQQTILRATRQAVQVMGLSLSRQEKNHEIIALKHQGMLGGNKVKM
jgi:hypothetical protein